MSRPHSAMILCPAALLLAGCSDDQAGFGPGDATASETRAISDAAEMAAMPRPSANTDANTDATIDTGPPLPQTAGDKVPDQAQ